MVCQWNNSWKFSNSKRVYLYCCCAQITLHFITSSYTIAPEINGVFRLIVSFLFGSSTNWPHKDQRDYVNWYSIKGHMEKRCVLKANKISLVPHLKLCKNQFNYCCLAHWFFHIFSTVHCLVVPICLTSPY